MCGILGQVTTGGISRSSFEERLLKLDHRGPDDYGIYTDDYVSLGQTRLSIIDLSMEGHQPMVSHCGNFVIGFNGEVYNYDNLRKQLIREGVKFKSNSDTEVILNGYIRYKEAIVSKLNGMFSFSIYNRKTKDLFFARDQSGIKPLYLYKSGTTFSFSSELKALTDYNVTKSVDSKALFLLLGYVPEPFTIYEEISMFPAGCFGIYRDGQMSITQFANYIYEPKISRPYAQIVKEVKDIFNHTIERHLISDAPIGCFLSGGVDSSIITAVAAQYRQTLPTISITFDKSEISEKYFQDLIVKKFGTKHTNYIVDEKLFLNTIDSFVGTMDQPTVDGLNTYFVSKAARETGLKAALSGIGGDEIFYGYPSFKRTKTLNFLSKIPYSIIKIFEHSAKYKKLELLQAEQDFSFYLPQRALFSPADISKLLNICKDRVYGLISDLWQIYRPKSSNGLMDKISFFELNMYMKNQLLRDADVYGMANSLEIRVPFLDKELVDYVLRIDPKLKMGKFNKKILVDMSKGLVPHEILERSKVGFTLPFSSWFNNNIEYFDVDDSVKHQFETKKISWSRLWAIYILKKWDK